MISATFFGEITELDSRAVFYSDEEDEDDEIEDEVSGKTVQAGIEPPTHDQFRSNIQLSFSKKVNTEFNFKTCIINLSSSNSFKNNKIPTYESVIHLGDFDNFGRAFAYPNDTLWLLFDSSHKYISGYEVNYFVENLREQLLSKLCPDNSTQIILISQQFSNSDNLEFLSNCNLLTKIPFVGNPLNPPSIIRNQFESALFEQLTLCLKPTLLVCLPSPRNYWFDRTKNWPSIPKHIIDFILNDDHLEKTLIFT